MVDAVEAAIESPGKRRRRAKIIVAIFVLLTLGLGVDWSRVYFAANIMTGDPGSLRQSDQPQTRLAGWWIHGNGPGGYQGRQTKIEISGKRVQSKPTTP